MIAAVHISIDSKRKIAIVVHTDDPHSMLIVFTPHVPAFLIREAEYFSQFILFSVIKPEISLLYKCNDRLVTIRLILDIA